MAIMPISNANDFLAFFVFFSLLHHFADVFVNLQVGNAVSAFTRLAFLPSDVLLA